ncbi:MAG: DUF6790 family protein [Phycisphaeraceae bacterium]
MGIYIFYFALAIAGAAIHLHRTKEGRTRKRVLQICLLWTFGVLVGLTGVMAAVAHTFMADQTAKEIGFPAGNPFQFEVAMADLAIGVLGLMCLRFRDEFWLATIVAASVFLLGDAYGHIHQIVANNNHEPGNAGLPLYLDIVVPVGMMLLYVAYRRAPESSKTKRVSSRSGAPAPVS